MTFAERIAEAKRAYENEWLEIWWPWYQKHLSMVDTEIPTIPDVTITQEFLETYILPKIPVSEQGTIFIPCFTMHVTPAFIRKHKHLQWNWTWLSGNGNIPIQAIIDNLDLPWDKEIILSRYDITPELLTKLPIEHITVRDAYNPALITHILKHPEQYNVVSASTNPKITLSFIEQHIDIFLLYRNEWYLSNLARLPIVTLDFILKYRFLIDWDMVMLSQNPNLTTKFLMEHLDWNWKWNYISKHPMITPEFIRTNGKTLPFDWDGVMRNPSIPIEFIIEIIDKYAWSKPDFRLICDNPNFRLENVDMIVALNMVSILTTWTNNYIMKHLVKTIDQVYHYSKLLKIDINLSLNVAIRHNPNITVEMINIHPELSPRIRAYFMDNPNATMQFISETLNINNHARISHSRLTEMSYEYNKFMTRKNCEHMAAYKIQRQWREVICNPAYAVCRRKLEYDFDTVIGNK